ncbi:MAG: carbohydrate binding domain-containing protein [Pirellulaceae bacterium]
MNRRMLCLCGVLWVLLHGLAAYAHANLILNGGFEDFSLPPGATEVYRNMPSLRFMLASTRPGPDSHSPSIGAWRVVGPGVALVQRNYAEPEHGMMMFGSQEGFNFLDLTGPGNAGFGCGVHQTVTTVAGQLYALTFFVGRAAGTSDSYAEPAAVDLCINGGDRIRYINTDLTPGTVNWMPFRTLFTAEEDTTTITFFNGTSTPTGLAGLDDITLLAVHEPATAVLFLLGGAAGVLIRVGRRRRSR